MVSFNGWYSIPCTSNQNWTDKKFQDFAINTSQYRVPEVYARAIGSDAYLLKIKDSDEKAFENYAKSCGIVYHRPSPQDIKRSQALVPFTTDSARYCTILMDLMRRGFAHTKTYHDNGKVKEIIFNNDNPKNPKPAIIGKFDDKGSLLKYTAYLTLGEDTAIMSLREFNP